MKKLESLKNEKFTVSNSELNQIKGGYDANGTRDDSFYVSDTSLANGGVVPDYRPADIVPD
jgi:hypothetical protein